MTSRNAQYLTRRGEYYQLRIPIPVRLQSKLHRKELRRSLNTTDLHIARRKVFRAVLIFDEICHYITMSQHISKAESHEIVGAFYELLNQAHTPTPPMMASYCPADAQDQATAAESYAMEFANRVRTNTVTGYDEHLMQSLLGKLGINLRRMPEVMQRSVVEGISEAYFEHARFVEHRVRSEGDDYQSSHPAFSAPSKLQLAAIKAAPTPTEAFDEEPLSIGELIEDYIHTGETHGHSSTGPWGASSLSVNRKVLRWFTELVGAHTPVHSISQKEGRDFRDLLRKVKLGTPADAALKSALTKNPKKAISASTAANQFGYLKSFFNWLEAEGHIERTPMAKLTIKIPKKPKSEEIRPFTTDEINALFSSPLYTGYASVHTRSVAGPKKPLRDGFFWLPLILLTTGMRIGEASELPIRNVKLDVETPHFLIEDSKTYAGGRKVPIHNLLLELGFAEWVQRLEKKYSPTKPLMSDFKTTTRLKAYASKKIGKLIDAVVTKDPTIVTHSFRHYFKDRARDAKIPEYMQDQIVGHEGKQYVGDGYGKGASLFVLAEEMNKITFELLPEIAEALRG